MKIYLASRFSDRPLLREHAAELWQMGHSVTSRWLHETARPAHMTEDEHAVKTALVDIVDLHAADLMIRFLHDASRTGGADTEVGLALAAGKLLWIVGPYRNIFHRLADRRFDTWEEARDALREMV
jgi:nucleoside 2-deoxyribosyltransferase